MTGEKAELKGTFATVNHSRFITRSVCFSFYLLLSRTSACGVFVKDNTCKHAWTLNRGTIAYTSLYRTSLPRGACFFFNSMSVRSAFTGKKEEQTLGFGSDPGLHSVCVCAYESCSVPSAAGLPLITWVRGTFRIYYDVLIDSCLQYFNTSLSACLPRCRMFAPRSHVSIYRKSVPRGRGMDLWGCASIFTRERISDLKDLGIAACKPGSFYFLSPRVPVCSDPTQ